MASYYNWTEDAITCYKRHRICNGCEISELTSGKCKMKEAVIQLVRKFGIPKTERKLTNE